MSGAFLTALRESLQCTALLFIVLLYPPVRERWRSLAAGVLAALALAIVFSGSTPEAWAPFRLAAEFSLLYCSLILLHLRFRHAPPKWIITTALFGLGLALAFFDFRSAASAVREAGRIKESLAAASALAALGIVIGFAPLAALPRLPGRELIGRALSLPSALVLTGALKIVFGGVAGVDELNLTVTLQKGMTAFLAKAVSTLQGEVMLPPHEFLTVPLSGLFRYLGGESMAMVLMVLLVLAPPLALMLRHFSRPDPNIGGIEKAARRRLEVSFFRRDFMLAAAPMMIAFVIIMVSIHAANVSLNPMSEPAPIPVHEEESTGEIRIPVSDRLGDLTDGKLRKYLYPYGQKKIMFIAIMKPDGTVGVALDECEICRPAEWNADAKGYAQRGENLVCKYCMTPISVNSVNKPGGCNPIPLPFKTDSGRIIVRIDDLIRTYNEAQKLTTSGSHL